jgi:hypothetical protein
MHQYYLFTVLNKHTIMKESLMMVTKYFNNVNKTNNNLSRPMIEHKKISWHMELEIQFLAYDRHKMWRG